MMADRLLVSAGLSLALLTGGAQAVLTAGAPTDADAARVVELRLTGEVDPVTAEYIDDGIDRANQDNAALILIVVDTPGGLDASMREIIQHILDSRAPVAVYVTPAGARAASAGFFITLSADVAAMAPGTHIGAASPLAEIGGIPITIDETLRKKIVNDATAYLRSFAVRRGRNVALAETAITDAKAFTEQEALAGRLCDLIAESQDALLAALNGRPIRRLDGRTSQIDLTHPQILAVEMTARQRFLARIVQPDAFFILLLVGVLGLYTEFTHPGMVAPGVVGGIALVLALFAMHLLPINLTGLLLIGLAVALFILEAHYTSHGVLGAGGIVAMLLGALLLVRSPLTGEGVSVGVALGATLPFALLTVVLMRLVLRSRTWKPQTGVEELTQEIGEVAEPIGGGSLAREGRGIVFVHGELWQAVAQMAIPKGARVRILRVEGLTLHVEPIGTSSAG